MKKRLSTKLLAIFMAVLMLVTAVPFAAFAYDYNYATNTDSNISTLKNAINDYESGLRDGTIYADMYGTYEMYVAAKKAYDAYVYGGRTEELATKAEEKGSALAKKLLVTVAKPTVVTDESTPVTGNNVAANWTVKLSNSNSDDDKAISNYSNKVLWASTYKIPQKDGLTLDSEISIWGTKSQSLFYIQYGPTVLLYDGEGNAPQFPVIGAAKRGYYGLAGATNTFQAVYCSTSGFAMNGSWKGGNKVANDMHFSGVISGNSYIDGTNTRNGNKWTVGNDDYTDQYAFAASIVYNGGVPSSNPNNLSFTLLSNNMTSALSDKDGSGSNTKTDSPIYFVNYVPMKTLLNETIPNFAFLDNIANYTEDSTDVGTLMYWIDEAYKFNPSNSSTWDYSSNTGQVVKDVQAEISKIVDNVNTNNINANKDPNGYNSFKTSITNAEAMVAAGNTAYTSDSWGKLTDALDKAHAHFADMGKLYTNYGDLKSNLDTALTVDTPYDAPAGLDTLANFTELEAANALFASIAQNKYTVASLEYVRDNYVAPTMLNESKTNTSHTRQSEINAQRDVLNALYAKLAEPTDWIALGTAAAEEAIDNTDKYDSSKLAGLVGGIDKSEYSVTVDVAGHDVDGLDQARFMEIALETINDAQWPYTVTIDNVEQENAEGKNVFHYGDTIKIKPEKAYVVKVTAGETDREITHYVSNTDTLEVRGHMTVISTDSAVENTAKFVTEGGILLDVVVGDTDGNVYFANANIRTPVCSKVSKYLVNGEEFNNDVVNVSEGSVTVVVCFEPVDASKYTITCNGDFYTSAAYNEYVSITVDGAAGFINNTTGELLWVGDTYSFYACESIDIAPVDNVTAKGINTYVVNNPTTTYDERKIFVGSYTNAENVTVKSQGFLIDIANTSGTLTLADVKNGEVYNFSGVSADEETHQFAFRISGVPSSYRYCAYVTYETTEIIDGAEVPVTKTVYSTIHTVTGA